MKKMIGVAVVTTGLGLCANAFAQAPLARPLTPADTLATRDIGDIAVSPDGSSIACTVNRSNLSSNRTDTTVMMLRAGENQPTELSLGRNSPSSLRWSPVVAGRNEAGIRRHD